jgi:hypothetical protein
VASPRTSGIQIVVIVASVSGVRVSHRRPWVLIFDAL